jgi:cytochrome c-type biogenesis protein CcmH/NrfG
MKRFLCGIVAAFLLGTALCVAQGITEKADVNAARLARNRADVATLQKLAQKTKTEAEAKKSVDVYVRLALFHTWLCEAIESRNDDSLFKKSAEDGVSAAEKAVALNPESSQAHQLLGDLINQLIPHVNGGGMKYGQRATDEMDIALRLDPKNAEAMISRAIGYYYSPASFGGNKEKAFDMLRRAVEIGSAGDTPHIWLAMFYLQEGKKKEAMDEIQAAQKIEPQRAFTNFVYTEINKSK